VADGTGVLVGFPLTAQAHTARAINKTKLSRILMSRI
jgi:hypothetical protein